MLKMKKLFKSLGWYKYNGKLDIFEIFMDITIILATIIVVVSIYFIRKGM